MNLALRLGLGTKQPLPSTALEITFARGVLQFIERQVLTARDETGGLLLGNIGPGNRRVVLAASPPGPKALHHPTMFERDLDFSQFVLNEVYARHGLSYVGEWHKHPSMCTEPSGGDEVGCRSILSDPDYRIDGLLLFPIFTVSPFGAVKSHYFYMDRSLRYRTFSPSIEDRPDFTSSIVELERQYLQRLSKPEPCGLRLPPANTPPT
jgi:integrative and conjugative element protein (TIGR02256 family)